MLPALLGGYVAAYPPPPLPPATAAAPSSSARLPAPFPARVRHASRLVARRCTSGVGAGEAVSASAVAEGDDEYEAELQEEGFPRWEGGGGGGGEEEDYDHDPEIGDIMGDYFDDPKKAQTRMEERIRKKRHKIVQAKTGSPNPMKVVFNKFDFSNSYIWFEFYNALLPKDATLISDALRSWHIVGRLGGCNSMNMQLSQLPLDCKRPTYDALEGANVTPTSFYNIGDLEIQDNLARVWVDIGIHEPLLLDILLNALTTISSDHVGIKQVQFGGSELVNWNEDLKTEEVGYSVRKI
ncbi:uncharacterized protein LOC120673409 [Panicum virgatum]|uniref:Uncharacterized protein n=1 Tax=Panicum virgatum TaxID=38727 RepID=A0A8T0RSI9_PANVG|nr:uncharacterized protein LOC120673409 [Panicum virgatum]KAG2589392.1 hypothetical protein PVAP13_5NG237300 [Panicum virgatum]